MGEAALYFYSFTLLRGVVRQSFEVASLVVVLRCGRSLVVARVFFGLAPPKRKTQPFLFHQLCFSFDSSLLIFWYTPLQLMNH